MDARQVPSWGAGNNPGRPAKTRQNGLKSGCPPRSARFALWCAVALLAACGRNPEAVPEAPPYTDPGFVVAGGWRMDYALTMTRDLPAAIAGSYGIEQRPNLALLTITISPSDSRAGSEPEAPMAEATVIALTGERTTLTLARYDESRMPTWLASVEVRERVPVTVEIRARATARGPELRARLTREFRLE